MTDPIADMLTRIRNAQAVSKQTVSVPFSQFKLKLAEVLLKNRYLLKVEKDDKDIKGEIVLTLGYDEREPLVKHIKRISTPGQRIYVGKDKIRPVLKNYGISIVSTPEGLMTNKEAKKRGIGGEIICEVW